jgi:hypothetical protein
VDWSQEQHRSAALNVILRRLDKTIVKIAKKPSTRRRANWTAIGQWLTGLHQTLQNYPYIAHLHSLKVLSDYDSSGYCGLRYMDYGSLGYC